MTATESAVLGLLTEGERSGYELHKRAEESVGHFWTPAKSRIYAVLPRLVAAGYATRRDVRQQRRPDKQLYRITPAGEEALRAWLHALPRSNDELLLKVFFGRHLERERLVALVEARREQARADLAAFLEIEDRLAADAEGFFGHLTLRWGLSYAHVIERWCDETLDALAERDDA